MSVQAPSPPTWELTKPAPATPDARPTPSSFALPLLAVAVALAAWFAPMAGVDLRQMSSIGLLSVLPLPSLLGLALLCVSFCVEIRRPAPRVPILLVHALALVVMVYGTPAIIEPEPRFAVTWRHIGIVETILHRQSIDPSIDAYFNWPGFFAAVALIARAAGIHSLISVAAWAPLTFELLALAPLLLIMRALSSSARLQWMAIWIFYLSNWVGQDYFSPQGFAYLLFLVFLGAMFTWLRANPNRPTGWNRLRAVNGTSQHVRLIDVRRSGAGATGRAVTPRAQTAVVASLILITAAIIASHQLTPFALVPGLTVAVLLRRVSPRGLPLLMTMMIATWMAYLASAYLSGHAGTLLGKVGHLDSIVGASVTNRVAGSGGHRLVTSVQLCLAGGIWIMAGIGAWRRWRRGHDDLAAIALAAGCFVLPIIQPYGGEIVLRIFMFSLPFAAFFVATLLMSPQTRGISLGVTAVTAVLCLGLVAGQLLVRYGNEQMDWFSRNEVRAVQALYRDAPPRSTLVAWSTSLPWKYRDYAEHSYRVVTDNRQWSAPAALPAGSSAQLATLAALLRQPRHGAYLVLTRSQAAQVDLLGLGPRGSLERLWQALARSPLFRVVYSNPDGIVVTARRGRA